jgi:hypothetical protein
VPTPGGASDDGGAIPSNPITPTDPVPPLEEPQMPPPVAERHDSPIFSYLADPARVERSALEIAGMLKPHPADWLPASMPDLKSHPYALLITYSRDLYTLLGCSPNDKIATERKPP